MKNLDTRFPTTLPTIMLPQRRSPPFSFVLMDLVSHVFQNLWNKIGNMQGQSLYVILNSQVPLSLKSENYTIRHCTKVFCFAIHWFRAVLGRVHSLTSPFFVRIFMRLVFSSLGQLCISFQALSLVWRLVALGMTIPMNRKIV